MRPITIVRTTGEEPLRFNGTLLWQDRTPYGRSEWVETRIFITEDGRYVLWLAFRSQFEHEDDAGHMAWTLPDMDAVLATLWAEHPEPEGVVPGTALRLEAYEDVGQVAEEKRQAPIIVLRTGQRPLRFNGTLLAAYDGSPYRSTTNDWEESPGRWVEVQIYETVDGRHILSLTRRTDWEGERNQHSAWVLDTPTEVLEMLEREAPRAAKALSRQLEGVVL